MKTVRSDTHLIARDDVLALLEDGPKDTGVLATWLGHPNARIVAALNLMARDGLVKRVGAERRWALSSYEAPKERPHLRDAAARRPIDDPLELTAGGDEPIDDVELEESEPEQPSRPKKRGRPLRHPHSRPPSASVPKDQAPAWWATAPRVGFTRMAEEQELRMRSSEQNRHVPLRMLQ